MESVADHKPEIGQLSGQKQQALDELPVQHIAQAQHQGGQAGHRISLLQSPDAGIGGISLRLLEIEPFHRHTSHLSQIPSLFMASFIALVCSAAFSLVTVPLRIALPIFSTGVQQLFI